MFDLCKENLQFRVNLCYCVFFDLYHSYRFAVDYVEWTPGLNNIRGPVAVIPVNQPGKGGGKLYAVLAHCNAFSKALLRYKKS